MTFSPDSRIAGILAPLFALRSDRDLGVGDIATLRELIDWSAAAGFRLVQLLPINETGADNSPYMAVSSAAIEPTTLEISPGTIPGLSQADFDAVLATVNLPQLRAGAVAYSVVKSLKRMLLERAFESFARTDLARNTGRARAFRAWAARQEAWLEGYGLFRFLMDENHVNERWDLWPLEQQTFASAHGWLEGLSGAARKRIEKRLRFYKWVQWLAYAQWQGVKTYAEERGVSLMGDVPFGISYYSADVFTEPELFDLEWSGGAPPEPAFQDNPFLARWGQNWGVPLYRWAVHEETGYRWWKRRVCLTRKIFHLFRIDHVLGFYRIYGFPWRPQRNEDYATLSHEEARQRTGGLLPRFFPCDDGTEEHRQENRRHGERILRVLLEETGPFSLIGEDLGTVPPYVRPSLTSLGIAGFKIPLWENKQDGWLIDGADYQHLSLATYATHDHEPLRAWWETRTRAVNEGGPARGSAWDQLVKLAGFAHLELREARPWGDELHETLLRALFACGSWMAVCMVTDLFGSAQRFNVPGAVAESNWSERLPYPISVWRTEPDIVAKARAIRRLLKETGRI